MTTIIIHNPAFEQLEMRRTCTTSLPGVSGEQKQRTPSSKQGTCIAAGTGSTIGAVVALPVHAVFRKLCAIYSVSTAMKLWYI